jgi:hypothetical protein
MTEEKPQGAGETPPGGPVPAGARFGLSGAGQIALALAGVGAILLTQLVCMKRTNFTGFDEWLMIELVSRGIVSIPYANRPMQMLWLLPADLVPYSLTGYVVLHGVYAFLSGALVFLLCRRLMPTRPTLCLMTAVFSVVWGPGDLARLSTIERADYVAFEFGTLLAILLLVESWRRRSVLTLASGMAVAYVVSRSYEAPVPLLAAAPVLLLVLAGGWSRRLRNWAVAWECGIACAVASIVLPRLMAPDQVNYQLNVLGLDLNLLRIARRQGQQFLFHIAPLVLSPWSELADARVGVAVLVFGVVAAAWALIGRPPGEEPAQRRALSACMAGGLAWAALAYLALTLTRMGPTALRMQMLSAPGIALFLASLISIISEALPWRWRRLALGLMGAWIVAVGTGRTVAMQKTWDRGSFYRAQTATLEGLTQSVPDVRPGTLILLLDEDGAWRATFGFRHAVLYLYRGHALGWVRGAWDALYPTSFGPEGIRTEPWRSLRRPWQAPVTLTRYEDTIVVRCRSGRVQILEDWPPALPPLPPGARYDPQSRIVRGSRPPEQAILGS